jgi:hypothetical protein
MSAYRCPATALVRSSAAALSVDVDEVFSALSSVDSAALDFSAPLLMTLRSEPVP